MNPPEKAKRPLEKGALPPAEEGAACAPTPRGSARAGIATVVLLGTLVCLVSLSTFLWLSGLGDQPQVPAAAIVDQLSLTQPNPSFVRTATSTLQRSGYVVDYYPGEEVTVNFYRDLPARGYNYVILRVHSAALLLSADVPTVTGNLALFTSEPYSLTKYVAEQRARRLDRVVYDAGGYAGGPQYFGINPGFVESSMEERFEDATVVLMGCDGLRSDKAATAFLRKGAKAVIGWDGPVSAVHTDAATENLLHHLLVERLTIEEAVTKVMAEVGPDPANQSSLLFYPRENAASGLGAVYPPP